LLAKRRQGCRERASIERAEGMDARSERPARWHGLTRSLQDGDRGLGRLVVRAWRGAGSGEAQRPVVRRYKSRVVFGSAGGLGVLVGDGCVGFRGRLLPNGPPSRRLAPGGFYASTRAVYAFARGGPCQSSRRCWRSEGRDAGSEPASSERRAWMPEASVRRDGTGHPEPRARQASSPSSAGQT